MAHQLVVVEIGEVWRISAVVRLLKLSMGMRSSVSCRRKEEQKMVVQKMRVELMMDGCRQMMMTVGISMLMVLDISMVVDTLVVDTQPCISRADKQLCIPRVDRQLCVRS